MKPETKALLGVGALSILFTTIITGLISGGLWLLNGYILPNILLTLAGVLVFGYMYNTHVINKFNMFVISKQAEVAREAQLAEFDIECCNCGKMHTARVDFTNEMKFTCDECNVENKIFYTIKTGRITDIPDNLSVVNVIRKIADNEPDPTTTTN